MAFSNVQTTVLDLAGGGSDSVAHDTAGAYDWIAVAIEGGQQDFTATVTYGGQSIAQKATDRTGISYRGDGRSIVFARVASDGSMPSAGSNTFAVTITGSPEACKARIWTGLATNPAILSDHDSAVNATAAASVAFGTKAGMAFMAACVGGSGSDNIWNGYGALDQDLTTLSWVNVVPTSHGVLAATDTTTTGTVTFSWYATAVMVALLGIVEGDVVIEPGRVGEAVSFRAGLTITAPSDGTVFLTRLGERVRWRAGLRITSTAKRQVALIGGGIQTPEMTESGTEGQVLTQHATRKPTWEDAGGGVTDHGALTGLGDDDHGAYALMVSQDAEPSDPGRPEALWYDSDAPAVDPSHPEAAIPVVFVEPEADDYVDVRVPFDCHIIRGSLLADQAGDLVVDVWVDAFANHPPIDADSITASAPLTLSTADSSEDSTLTGWTLDLAKGDVIRFHVDSAADVLQVTAVLEVERT